MKEWYSPDLNKVIIHFKKALHLLNKSTSEDIYRTTLESQISTNLGNYLSQQGRFMCAKKFWQRGISLNNQPIAHTAMYQSEIYIANYLKDHDVQKAYYHYHLAYQSLLNRLKLSNEPSIFNDSYLIFDDEQTKKFKQWFEEKFDENDFDQLYTHHDESDLTEIEAEYLAWCSDNNLFIDELEIDELRLAIYPDSLNLPPFTSPINSALANHEELVYHANFEEIKNDFCYARHLIFITWKTEDDEEALFDSTFLKLDDGTYPINNIKAQNLKSAFKILYSLFDKIAYFINHFFDLNEIEKDQRINFESLFKKLNSNNQWLPHPKLVDSKNQFLHALFYILKDLRDIKNQESVSDWLNPEITKIYEMRNFIEHRSFKIIDSMYENPVLKNKFNQKKFQLTIEKKEQYTNELTALCPEFKKYEGTKKHQNLVEQQEILVEKITHIDNELNEKEKRSKHTLMITDKDFNTQLMTLAELIRNSIIYLAFSINYEEQFNAKKDDGLVWHRDVPTK